MSPDTVVGLLSGNLGALVVLIWWVTTLRQDMKELRKTNEALQRQADSAVEAARTSNALFAQLISQSRIQRGVSGGENF